MDGLLKGGLGCKKPVTKKQAIECGKIFDPSGRNQYPIPINIELLLRPFVFKPLVRVAYFFLTARGHKCINFTLIFSKISYNFAVGFIYFLLVKVNINIGHSVPSMPESSCNRFFGYV